jgi:molybdate transport system regulatory protein
MDASVDTQLRAGEVSFTGADADLLRAVATEGSVSGASETLGRSRARALNRIETLESAFGPLVERERGGATGGGSSLTPSARTLLARFQRLRATLAGTAAVEECVIDGTVVDGSDELCVVETEAGEVRARLVDIGAHPPADGRVQVSVRADTVTLQTPTDAPAGAATSARNRFEGPVVAVDDEGGIGRVTVDIGAADHLVALLTDESFERLALAPGDPVVASFKATATRALPLEQGNTTQH